MRVAVFPTTGFMRLHQKHIQKFQTWWCQKERPGYDSKRRYNCLLSFQQLLERVPSVSNSRSDMVSELMWQLFHPLCTTHHWDEDFYQTNKPEIQNNKRGRSTNSTGCHFSLPKKVYYEEICVYYPVLRKSIQRMKGMHFFLPSEILAHDKIDLCFTLIVDLW